jgi:5-methylcytosine-specific restriction endonuclease McrA
MSAKRGKAPTVAEIAKAQDCLLEWIGLPRESATSTCWACRIDTTSLERAHVVAHRNGGSMHPTNFFLLCPVCHEAQDDFLSVELQLLWLKHAEPYQERILRRAQAYVRALNAGSIDACSLGRLMEERKW